MNEESEMKLSSLADREDEPDEPDDLVRLAGDAAADFVTEWFRDKTWVRS